MEPHTRKEENTSGEPEDPGSSRKTPSLSNPPSPNNAEAATNGGRYSFSFVKKLGIIFSLKKNHKNGNGHNNGNGTHDDPEGINSLKEALEAVLEEHESSEDSTPIPQEEKDMLQNILRFGEMTVSDIMIPRTDIIAAENTSSFEDIKELVAHEQHSRIPIYKESLDQIEGFVHLKDLAIQHFASKPFNLEVLLRKMLFVPPSMKVLDLLVKMRSASVHIAIVVDEYGGTDGMVTMEDIVEEIVGEIQDEHDDEIPEAEFTWIDNHTIEADARMEIEKLDECFEASVARRDSDDDDDFDTVGGMVFSFLDRVPETGEYFDYPTGLRITILEADPRSIKRVRIERTYSAETELPEPALAE